MRAVHPSWNPPDIRLRSPFASVWPSQHTDKYVIVNTFRWCGASHLVCCSAQFLISCVAMDDRFEEEAGIADCA